LISAFFRLLVLTSGNDAVSAGIGGAHYFGVVGKVGAPHSLSCGAPLAGTLLTAWQNSEYRQAAFRSYVSSRYGGQNIGRPDDMQRALVHANEVILQRLAPNDAADAPRSDTAS
jgi:hypothetical protein